MERKVLIVTHSDLADGLAASIEFFLEGMFEVTTICAFTKENNPQEKIIDYFGNQSPDTEIIAFSDVLFGSVNQWLGTYIGRPHYHLITGTNLPVILAVLMKNPGEYLTNEDVVECIESCADSIIYVNNYQPETDDEDE